MERILVVGATGAQGGSVARELLRGKRCSVRVLTRKPESDSAAALRAAGAEVVRGDLEDRDSLGAALDGCDAVFGVTNYWEHFDREREQGKNLVDAIAASQVRHFVFSTLPAAKEISHGALDVPHFDIKADVAGYARQLGLPTTFLHVAFYYENFLSFFPPLRQEDGSYAFGFPQGDTPLAAVSVGDVGGIVAAVLTRSDEFLGRTVGVVGDDQAVAVYSAIMSRVLGVRIVYRSIPRETFAAFGFRGAADLANMFEFNRLYIPNRRADLEESRALHPAIGTFERWLRANASRFASLIEPAAADPVRAG